MDNQRNFYKDGVARVLEALRDTFGDEFTYYDDDKPDLLESDLPAMMVKETQGEVQAGATGTDNVDEQIQITIVMNLKDDLGALDNTDLTGVKLRRLIKGQYPEGHAKAGQYHENTVMYALRQNFTLDNALIDSTVQIDMDVAKRGESFYTKEAYVTLAVRRIALVPSRV